MTDRGKMNLDKVYHWQAFLFVLLSFQSLTTAQDEKAMQSDIKKMLNGFPPGFIPQTENVVSRCYGNDKSLPENLENLIVKSILQIGSMMAANALKINQTALVNKSDNNNTMMMPMNMSMNMNMNMSMNMNMNMSMNMNMNMNMNMPMDMNTIMNMHQNMTMMKPGNIVNCTFFLVMLELIRNTTNETQGLVTAKNPFCPLLSFAAPLAWEALVTDTNYMNHSLFQLMLWSAQPFIQFGLKPEKLSSMAPKFFMGSHRKLAMDMFNKFYDNMPQGAKEKIVQWVKSSVIMETLNCTMGNQMTSEAGMIKGKCPEQPVWLKSDALSSLGRFLPQISDSDLDQITADELCKFFNQSTFFDTFKQMYDLNQKQGKMLISKLSSQCLNPKMSESVFARLGALACFYDNVGSLNKNQSQILLPQMSGCKNPGTNKIITDMMKTAMGSEPLTAQMLKTLGNTTKGLSVSQLCSMNGSDIRNSIEDLGKISWTKEQSTALVQKYIKEVKTPSSSDLVKMGKLIKGVPCSVIQNMKGDQLFNIAGLEDNAQDLSPAQKKALINTILNNVNISTVLQTFSGPLISTLSLYTIQQANINTVDRIVGKNWTKCQAIHLVKQVFSGKIQASDIKKLGSAIQGITCDMFSSLSDQDILTTASILEQNKDWLSRHQMICFAKKLWTALNTTRADYFSSIQDSEMQLIPAVFLIYLPPSQIAKIPAKACSSFLEKMASADITLLPRTSLTRPALRDRALLCLNKTLPLISSSDLQQLGLLVCELNMTEIPASVLDTSLQLFTQCRQLSSSNKAILAKRMLTTYGNCSSWKDTTITSLGPLMTFLSSSDLQTLPNAVRKSIQGELKYILFIHPSAPPSPRPCPRYILLLFF
ncbi:uncharacterized protein LOC127526646 [Erpetoichthys calabaricus]|uniref:uncharacterized protein LOC127526646 n=1 Tax=Erpetoichthys calabaricus TaxID=27687 RepID=UPI0022344FA2|nr:uncharacterized protein LOC127526646 [Erpetoichthys calabaricus]